MSNAEQRALSFLEQNPSISEHLVTTLGSNLNQVATVIEPILQVPSRCEVSPYYIHAIAMGRTAFLTTNLVDVESPHVAGVSTNWSIGRSRTCAIFIPHLSVSRCHGVIGYLPASGFYITDLGSSNGTFVNRKRLPRLRQHLLQDGDLIEFSQIRAEFFVSGWQDHSTTHQDTQF